MTNLKQISRVKDKKLRFVVPQCWTFFSQSKVQCQLRHFEHCPKLTMPYRVSKPCSELLDMTQTCPTKMFKIDRNDPHWPEDTLLKIAPSCAKLLKWLKLPNKCLKSIGVMCLYTRVRKLSSLGIAVAGVYCCMGLRSVSIEPR